MPCSMANRQPDWRCVRLTSRGATANGTLGDPAGRAEARPAGKTNANSKPGREAGLLRFAAAFYCAMRRLDKAVPICVKVATIWFAEVSKKNLLGSLAQFCNRVDVGSPPVLTCTV
jgi:hypothetical protein